MKLLRHIPRFISPSPVLSISKPAMFWLTGCLVLSTLWHIANLPVWVIAVACCLYLWRFLHDLDRMPLPPRKLRIVFTLAAALAVYLAFGSLLGRDAGLSALILFSALKILELKSDRDFMLVVYLCFFLLLGNFLYDQAIVHFFFMIVVTVFLTAAILRLNQQTPVPGGGKPKYMKRTMRLIFAALPIAVILFFFFPRTSGFFWNIRPFASQEGVTGFRDRIYPGEVARIIQSKETAFRVFFPDNNMPSYDNLYFRGLVLWYTDGKIWFFGNFRLYQAQYSETYPNAIRQEILLEPQSQPWLFALDRPHTFPRWSRQVPGQVFGTPRPLQKTLRYKVESTIGFQPSDKLSPMVERWSLQLPRRLNPRMEELVESWRAQFQNDEDVVLAALRYFQTGGFVYTLAPGRLDTTDPIPDFLFNKKQGFCEHFTAAFAILMRMAGIPTRVVIGYHGGKFNTVGGYLTVRQMDAHAWAEVWIQDKGWQRIDPTAAIAPDRIQYGIDVSGSISTQDGASAESRSDAALRALRRGFFKRAFATIKDIWETIEINWSLWIISYDFFQQWNFLEFLGLARRGHITLLIIMISAVTLTIFIIKFLNRKGNQSSSTLTLYYQKFCQRLKKKNVSRDPWEGPLHFKTRAVTAFTGRAREISRICDTYIKFRYTVYRPTENDIKDFKKQVRRFKL